MNEKMLKIIVNRAQCNRCHDIVISKHRHDYCSCSCGAIAVDGGQDYLKRVGNREDWTDMSVVFDQDKPIL